ncbi:MAG: DinB family protein [Trueperaceae bacterium]|nr:DinB family protein [Trueperaceae bacterium]
MDQRGLSVELVRLALASQYRAGLAMLREAVELCPDGAWESQDHANAFWQVAYHALYFTHLYLQPTPQDFVPWPGHQSAVQNQDGIGGPPDPYSSWPVVPDPYTKQQVLEYCAYIDERIGGFLEALDLGSPDCGFPWYQVSKFEFQLVNVRHLHHHMAQLADRVRTATGRGVSWVDAG